ncbi:MAG: hypothetical protein KatS3mg115_1607 [Candidatus Poribacteria bacterium]|nr:MAG: hypothetical protein KatS3mg115_1607 [Candidatus Poribacteria bacterium]
MTLKRRQEFERVLAQGRRRSDGVFVVYGLRRPGGAADRWRLGISVSKAVGKAVRRNRVRRLIREALRLSSERIADGWDLVVIARPAAVTLKCQQVQERLLRLLDRLGALREPEAPACETDQRERS